MKVLDVLQAKNSAGKKTPGASPHRLVIDQIIYAFEWFWAGDAR
jgi:hypothetical protein